MFFLLYFDCVGSGLGEWIGRVGLIRLGFWACVVVFGLGLVILV